MTAMTATTFGRWFAAMVIGGSVARGADEGARAEAGPVVSRSSSSESAASAATSVAKDGATTTKSAKRVMKDGKEVEASGDPALAKDLGLGELRKLGLDISGLDALIDDVVGRAALEALAGTLREGSSVKKGVKVNGVPVDARVEVKTGAGALREFERRCPELKGDLERLLRQVGGEFDCRLGRALEQQAEGGAGRSTSKPPKSARPSRATPPTKKPGTRPVDVR